MEFTLSDAEKQKFEENGCLVVQDFLTSAQCDELRKECSRIIDDMNPEEHRTIFSTGKHEQMSDDYLLKSMDKIGFFWEEQAKDDEGNLKVAKHLALNKMGHALHVRSQPFNEITFGQKIISILRKLGFVRPVIPQSMYIFKSPGIGGEVNRHIDASFLYSDPLKLIGIWIPLEDASLENACLKFARGSHKTTDVTLRMIRNPNKKEVEDPFLIFEGSLEFLPFSNFEAFPVKKGSLVLIDGKIQHCSDKNTSDKSRHVYTFHVTESHNSEWSKENWLQPTNEYAFPVVYDDSNNQ